MLQLESKQARRTQNFDYGPARISWSLFGLEFGSQTEVVRALGCLTGRKNAEVDGQSPTWTMADGRVLTMEQINNERAQFDYGRAIQLLREVKDQSRWARELREISVVNMAIACWNAHVHPDLCDLAGHPRMDPELNRLWLESSFCSDVGPSHTPWAYSFDRNLSVLECYDHRKKRHAAKLWRAILYEAAVHHFTHPHITACLRQIDPVGIDRDIRNRWGRHPERPTRSGPSRSHFFGSSGDAPGIHDRFAISLVQTPRAKQTIMDRLIRDMHEVPLRVSHPCLFPPYATPDAELLAYEQLLHSCNPKRATSLRLRADVKPPPPAPRIVHARATKEHPLARRKPPRMARRNGRTKD
jgi:hypothetical protein